MQCRRVFWVLTWLVVGTLVHAGAAPLRPVLPATVFPDFERHSLGTVNALAFDSTGCLWFGTSQGLFRFDGQRIRRFDTDDGLPDLHVYDVICDTSGVLYAGTWRGVGVFRDGRFQTVSIPGDKAATASPARRLALDRAGVLWAVGDGGILRRMEPWGGRASVVSTPMGYIPIPTHLAIDRRGRPWVAHLQSGDPPMVYCRVDTGFVPGTTAGVPADVVEMGSTEGGLWVQTGDGTVWREAAEGMHPALLPEEWQGGPLRQWFTTGEFNVLVGDSVVLRSADGRVPCAVAHSPLWGGARAAADAEGNVWCAAIPEGVVRLGPDPFEWFALPERLRIRVMEFGSEDVVWCGSEHGVHRGHWDGRGLMWASLPLPSVTVLRAVGAESVLVGTVDGAFLVSGMPPRIVARWTVDHGLPSPVVTALTGDDHSGWIGTLSGACRWRAKEPKAFVPKGMWPMAVTALLPDPHGLWMGTWAGLGYVNGDTLQLVSGQTRGLYPAITSLYRDSRDEIMVGTYSDGLFTIRGDTLSPIDTPLSRITSIVPRSQGLPFVVGVRAILTMDEGHTVSTLALFDEPHPIRSSVGMDDGIWVATSTSLERYGPLPPVSVGSRAGLPNESILTLSADGHGDLWIATEHYLCRVYRDRLGAQPLRGHPTVAVGHGSRSIAIPPGGRHVLPSAARQVVLEFGLPYIPGGEMEIRTRLEPLEACWTPWSTQWHREFGALPPGEQVVWVQARTPDGRLSPETKAAVISVPPLWHQRASVRIAGGLVLLLLGVLAGLSRTASARARARLLEARVQERTSELDAARAKAVEASRAKSLLLSRMSHEFRTPLSAMMGFADLIAESNEASEEHRGYAQVITDAGQKLLGLIRGILDLSRAEAAVVECVHVPFELRRLVQDVVQLLSVKASESGISLAVAEEGWPARPIDGDPDRLREVLINLVGNALKFTERGGSVHVTCRTDERQVWVSVRDTGPGISPGDQVMLFDPFVRLGNREVGEGGSGLGLTITRQLVEAMGGTISVESAFGGGSTFTVALPQQ